MEALAFVLGGVTLIVTLAWIFVLAACAWPNAERRAGALLRAVLTAEQYSQLIEQGHVDIPSPGDPERVYRVPRLPGSVQVRERGEITLLLCLQSLERVPDPDVVVMHKLMIEGDEETYLQKANQRRPVVF